MAADDATVMLHFAERVGVPQPALVLATSACARLALQHSGDGAALRTVEVAEAWARGETTRSEVLDVASVAAALAERVHHAARFQRTARVCRLLAARTAVNAVVNRANAGCNHAASAIAATIVELVGVPWSMELVTAGEREARRKMAAVVREHIPWTALAEAYAAIAGGG